MIPSTAKVSITSRLERRLKTTAPLFGIKPLAVLIAFLIFSITGACMYCAYGSVDDNQLPSAALSNNHTPTTATVFTVWLNSKTLYQLQRQTTFQQIATLDRDLLPRLMHELAAQGIEYDVYKNPDSVAFIAPGEYIVSWGGIVYLPQGFHP